ADAPGELPADEVVSDPERAVLHEDRRHRSLSRVERRLEHGAVGPAVGIRLQIEQLGLEQDLIEQGVHVLPGLRRDRRGERRTAELLDRKSTRLNSSHEWISYAVFCLKKKKKRNTLLLTRIDIKDRNA